jgi:PAS domain S-box-containing protein
VVSASVLQWLLYSQDAFKETSIARLVLLTLTESFVPSKSERGSRSKEDEIGPHRLAESHQSTKPEIPQNEQPPAEREAQFQLLVNAVQDYAIFILDPAGNIRTWNAAAERIKQYTAAEIVGKHFSIFYPEEDKRNEKPKWELEVAEKQGRFEDEGWRIRKDGSRFWANVIITPLRNKSGELVGFGKVTRDFTEQMEAKEALAKSERSLRELSLHLLSTQDKERKRIGRELHDSLGQSLAMLKLKLESAASLVSSEPDLAVHDIAQCIRLTDDCIKEVRTVSYLLYPPMLEERGLKSAIPWYLGGFSSRSGIKTSFKAEEAFGRLASDAELAMFRVLQESLTNVHRHSGSETADVRLLTHDGSAVLEVEDKGKGFNQSLLEQGGEDWMGSLGVGVRGMNERMRQLKGKLEIISQEGRTLVRATIPVSHHEI